MLNKIIVNDEFFVIHRIEKFDFFKISSIVIIVVVKRRRRVCWFNWIKKIKKIKIENNCSHQVLQNISLSLIKINILIIVVFHNWENRRCWSRIDKMINCKLTSKINKMINCSCWLTNSDFDDLNNICQIIWFDVIYRWKRRSWQLSFSRLFWENEKKIELK